MEKAKTNPRNMIILSLILLLALGGSILFMAGCYVQRVTDVVYLNEQYGFSLEMTPEFYEKTYVREHGHTVYFLHREINRMDPQGTMGTVGRIEIYEKTLYSRDDLQQLTDAYNFRYLDENEEYYFGWALPTDVQVPPGVPAKLQTEYREMEQAFARSLESFSLLQPAPAQGNIRSIMAYILGLDSQDRSLVIDEVEWVQQTDSARVEELGLDADKDFPNGYYIHNPVVEEEAYPLAEELEIYILDQEDLSHPMQTDLDGLAQRLQEYPAPYRITIQDGLITGISEQYIP